MELKEFISTTLKQVVEGVIDAQDYMKKEKINAIISPAGTYVKEKSIDFDVAITVNESNSTSAGGGINVASIITAGGKKNSESTEQSISRVKFSVGVNLPRQGNNKN